MAIYTHQHGSGHQRIARSRPVLHPPTLAMSPNGRWPDYAIIGAMKAGTTTLHDWLAQHPGVTAPSEKEPNFFSQERNEAAAKQYRNQFAGAGALLTGEASTSYSLDGSCADVAARMKSCVPSIRLIYLVRDPVERIRSHYRHEVRRNREQQPFGSAVTATSSYVSASCYGQRIQPFVELFGDQVLVVPSSQLFDDSATCWLEILSFLALEPTNKPATALNVGDTAPSFTRAGRLLWNSGALKYAARVPAPIRRHLRPVAIGRSKQQEQLAQSAHDVLPGAAAEALAKDAPVFRRSLDALGQSSTMWPAWIP